MSRVSIKLPDQFIFSTSITVQIGDINYGRHLSNDAVLRLCHEARLRFLHSLGYNEMNVAGAGLIMADVMIKFVNQSFHGDKLQFYMAIEEIGKAGFSLITQIIRESDNVEIARIKNGMVFFDYTTQTIARTPQAFIEHFTNLLINKDN